MRREEAAVPDSTRPSVAVLAGGLGSRIGGAKALAELRGRALIAYPIRAARGAGLEPVVVAKTATRLRGLGCRVIREDGRVHPLAGIVAGLEEAGEGGIVVVGCDMPFVPPAALAWLAGLETLAVPEVEGRLEPLLARYPQATASPLRRALERDAPLREAVAALGPRVVGETELGRYGEPRRIVFNVNSARDLEEAEALLSAEEAGAVT